MGVLDLGGEPPDLLQCRGAGTLESDADRCDKAVDGLNGVVGVGSDREDDQPRAR